MSFGGSSRHKALLYLQLMPEPKVIYDIGANTGSNIPYYLLRSDIVVAVEANPVLCEDISKNFGGEINSGRLILQNCVVTADSSSDFVNFYLHETNHVLSQLPQPTPEIRHNFKEVKLPSRSILDIVSAFGTPYYMKIDVEGYDMQLLHTLFSEGIRPPFISAESHSIGIFSTLVAEGHYNAFKLVDGPSVSETYSNMLIADERAGEDVKYSFPIDSAGPFGNDISGEWMSADNFFRLLAFEELGWKDIHATNQERANEFAAPSIREFFIKFVRNGLRRKFLRY